jgi:hypothetical protein
VPVFWCDGESSVCIVKFESEFGELKGQRTNRTEWKHTSDSETENSRATLHPASLPQCHCPLTTTSLRFQHKVSHIFPVKFSRIQGQWNSAEFRAGHRNRRGYSIPCFTCTALLTSHQPPQVQNTAKHGSGYRAEGHRDVYMANEGDMGRTVTYNSAKHIVITQAQQVVANYTRH